MKTLNTVKQAVKIHYQNEPTAQNFINGRILTVRGWDSFKFKRELLNFMATELSDKIGGRARTKEKIFNALRFRKPQHSLLARFTIQNYNNKYIFDYCTGQSQPEEMRELRNFLRKL